MVSQNSRHETPGGAYASKSLARKYRSIIRGASIRTTSVVTVAISNNMECMMFPFNPGRLGFHVLGLEIEIDDSRSEYQKYQQGDRSNIKQRGMHVISFQYKTLKLLDP